ncbi:unnamed protein product [Mytilus coruscus]|uniref:Uncharacterized protein n=1 Tax=Mytilus coruscus TaxID=42192 RepID=A0A6J8A5U7_MYTCO|nr:unnamed protein product [Mytilus coruscus]
MFYLVLFFCAVSASQSEFPCTFPCDWINKTFTLYSDETNVTKKMVFNADGTTGTFLSTDMQCFQISEQFLIIKLFLMSGDDESIDILACFPVFYTSGQSNFTVHLKDVARIIVNQTGALNDSQLCEICGTGIFSGIGTILALAPAPNVIPPAVCEVPFNCQSDSGIACPQGGSIPKECTGKDTTTTDKTTTTTTDKTTTTTTDKTTTTTADNPNTTRKKPCGRRGRLHRHGQ